MKKKKQHQFPLKNLWSPHQHWIPQLEFLKKNIKILGGLKNINFADTFKNEQFKARLLSGILLALGGALLTSFGTIIGYILNEYKKIDDEEKLSYFNMANVVKESIGHDTSILEVTSGWILEQSMMDVSGLSNLSQKGTVRQGGSKYNHTIEGKKDLVLIKLIFENLEQYKNFLKYWNKQCPGSIVSYSDNIIQNRVLDQKTSYTSKELNDQKYQRTTIIFNKKQLFNKVIPHIKSHWKKEHQIKSRWLLPIDLEIINVNQSNYSSVIRCSGGC